ncbi:MAG TPA: hypothetical protein VI146_05445, partial [Nitrososphaeraceae archaeon]
KTFYTFGQNTNYRDDGTEDGGTTGTLLGDAGSSIIIRHIHSAVRKPGTLDWYVCTGDAAPSPNEVAWLKFTYNDIADTWSAPSILYNPTSINEWKAIDINFNGNDLYFGTDGGSPTVSGIYKTTIANIGNTGLSTRTLSTTDLLANFKLNATTGYMVVVPLSNYIIVAQNFGATYFNYSITGSDVTTARMAGLSNRDARGYQKFQVGGFIGYNHFIKTVFIKEN